MKGDTSIPSAPAPGEISLDQARVIAIQHAREDTDFYGQEYGTVRLAWEVTSQEDTGNYYEIRLAYRPSGRFRGQPGVEQFTIGKTGNIELRQILDEPVLREPPKRRRPPTKWLAAAAAAIVAVVVGGVVVLKPFAPSPTVVPTAASLAAVPAVSDTPAPPPTVQPTAAPVVAVPTVSDTPAPTPTEQPTVGRTSRPAQVAAVAEAPQSDFDAQIQAIFERASEIRQLEPLRAVATKFITKEELLALWLGELDKEQLDREDSLQEIIGDPFSSPFAEDEPERDLYQWLVDLITEGVEVGLPFSISAGGAYYELETEVLHIVRDTEELTMFQEFDVATQYMKSLLQQHYDIRALYKRTEGNSDAAFALNALIEGDIQTAGQDYVFTYFTPQQLRENDLNKLETPVLDKAPFQVTNKYVFFHLSKGMNFVSEILNAHEGDWASLDGVYGSPPASTEQILNPERYIAGDTPKGVPSLPDLAKALGPGWTEAYSDVLGEYHVSLDLMGPSFVFEEGEPAGWGGDRFIVMKGPLEEEALAVVIVWDSAMDAQRFVDLVSGPESFTPFLSENSLVATAEDRTLLVRAPHEAVLARIKKQFPEYTAVVDVAAQDVGTMQETIFQQASEVRGLKPLEQMVPQRVAKQELIDLVVAKEVEAQKDDLVKQQSLLSTLGLIPRDLDLSELLIGIQTEDAENPDAIAYVDREVGQLYVLENLESLTVGQELTVAAWYIVGLLQQHYDIYSLEVDARGDFDAIRTWEAFVPADAGKALEQYINTKVSPGRFMSEGQSSEPKTLVFDSAPEIVQRWWFLNHTVGTLFVDALLESGGQSALNAAYSEFPASTEQIFHPQKYLDGEPPGVVTLPDVDSALGADWTEIYTGVMGEFLLREYAATLGGDRFSLVENTIGDRALAALILWDTVQDAQEFFDVVDANTDPSGGVFVGANFSQTLLVVAPFEGLLEKIKALFLGF